MKQLRLRTLKKLVLLKEVPESDNELDPIKWKWSFSWNIQPWLERLWWWIKKKGK